MLGGAADQVVQGQQVGLVLRQMIQAYETRINLWKNRLHPEAIMSVNAEQSNRKGMCNMLKDKSAWLFHLLSKRKKLCFCVHTGVLSLFIWQKLCRCVELGHIQDLQGKLEWFIDWKFTKRFLTSKLSFF